jgi:hypothetical protein
VKLDGTTALCEHGSVCRAHVKNGSIVSASCDPVIDDGLSCGTNTGFTGLKFPYGGPCRAPAVCSEHVCDLPSTTACGAPPLP